MKRIAKFHKVSEERFVADWKDTFPETQESAITDIYNEIKLPARATAGSAGYDFYAPVDLTLNPGETVKIPTGIRVEMEQDWVLKCYPRSGLGLNTVCSSTIRLESLTAIISILTMRDIFLQRSPMTATKANLSAFRLAQASCRESL